MEAVNQFRKLVQNFVNTSKQCFNTISPCITPQTFQFMRRKQNMLAVQETHFAEVYRNKGFLKPFRHYKKICFFKVYYYSENIIVIL